MNNRGRMAGAGERMCSAGQIWTDVHVHRHRSGGVWPSQDAGSSQNGEGKEVSTLSTTCSSDLPAARSEKAVSTSPSRPVPCASKPPLLSSIVHQRSCGAASAACRGFVLRFDEGTVYASKQQQDA